MAIRTELTNAMAVAESIDETVFFGINANTLSMDVRAWDMWEHVCRTQGTSPLRTAAEAREFPERNARLLACLLLHAFASGRPRDRSRLFIKPRSALAYPLAIVIAALLLLFNTTRTTSGPPNTAAAVQHNARTHSGPPSTGATITMDGVLGRELVKGLNI